MLSTSGRDTVQDNTAKLFTAIQKNDLGEVKRLIELEINWNKTIYIKQDSGDLFYTPIRLAAKLEYWDILEHLITKIQSTQPSSIAEAIKYGSVILLVTGANRLSTLKLMLNSDFAKKINESTRSEMFAWAYTINSDVALHKAVRNNNIEMIALLIDFGAPLSSKNSDKMTPTELALHLQHWECLKALSQHEALNASIFSKCSPDVILKMMQYNIELDAPDYQHEDLQDKRKEIRTRLLSLPHQEKINALKSALDKQTALGNYFLCYEQGFFKSLFQADLSAEACEICFKEELAKLAASNTKRTTANLLQAVSSDEDDDGIDSDYEGDIELDDNILNPNTLSTEESDTFESVEESSLDPFENLAFKRK